MDANHIEHMTEDEKRKVRAGYYKKNKKVLDDTTFHNLSASEIQLYKNFKENSWRSIGETALSFAFILGIVGFAVWPSISDNGSNGPTPPPPNCDPNYEPCIQNVDYDLDCPDINTSVTVIGTDVHRFDRDGDGFGCELN